jgi:hypothetical protein
MDRVAFTQTEEDVNFLVPYSSIVPRHVICKSSVLRQAVSSAEQDERGERIIYLPKGVLQTWLQCNEVLCEQPKGSRCSTAVANDARLLDFLLVRFPFAYAEACTAVQEISCRMVQWHAARPASKM